MKYSLCIAALLSVANAFLAPAEVRIQSRLQQAAKDTVDDNSRQEFIRTLSVAGIATIASTFFDPEPAFARGRATLEQSYERYAPRIKAGGDFYATELKNLVAANDWSGIKNALAEPPARKKEDLTKPDSGVAARARQAGGFSDARVLVAADLFGAAFSESSITPKTKKMQAAVAKEREIIKQMESTAKQALGEESAGGGLFGFGAKKPSKEELSKKMKDLYVQGGNAWNEYVAAANDNLALQFDRFEYIK